MTTVDWQPKTNRRHPCRTTKISNYSPAGKGGLPTRRPALKTNHNEKENLFVGGYPCRCGKCLRTGQRAGGHHRSHEPNHRVFRPRNKISVRNWGSLRLDWRGKSI